MGCRVLAVDYGYNKGEPLDRLNPDKVIGNIAEILLLCMSSRPDTQTHRPNADHSASFVH